LKRYIYLVSPQNIRGIKFYNELDRVLKNNKVKYFQLRLKKKSTSSLIKIAKKIKKITKKNKVKLLINDKPFVAKASNADGCHIGQKDMNFFDSRKILGRKKIIGMTCHNSKKLALNAKKIGVNYIAFGAFFKSSTKKTVYKANLVLLRWAKKKINMPIVAIGGINSSNYKKILSSGANYIACSNYVWNNKVLDPVSAIKKFK
jgi:thiamine-phosphate pyrophosphorylase